MSEKKNEHDSLRRVKLENRAGGLSDILRDLPKKEDKNLIVGYESSDDAAVYKISEDKAIIQTFRFFYNND